MVMRARNIKPGFFANEHLADLDPYARLLFIGLWTLADRSGRLEDRPKRIKAELFPYENVDADALIQSLEDSPERFVIRYTVNGQRYIQVSNFEKHQNPHIKEKASIIPSPCEHGASTVQAPYEHGICIEQARRIPDSGFLIPDTGLPITDAPGKGGKPPARAKFVPPTVDEVDKHCRERGNNIDAEYFCAYYEARGWELGKGKKMKDWKSAIITWEKREKERKQTQQTPERKYGFDL